MGRRDANWPLVVGTVAAIAAVAALPPAYGYLSGRGAEQATGATPSSAAGQGNPVANTRAPGRQDGAVLREGDVTLRWGGDVIDLDVASRGQANWGAHNGSEWRPDQLSYDSYGETYYLTLRGGSFDVVAKPPSYEQCSNSTTYGHNQVKISDLRANEALCARLSSGKFAGVVTKSADRNRATFRIVIWDAAN